MKKFMISSAVFAFAFAVASTAGAVYQSDIYTMSSGYLKVGSGYGAKASQNANVKAAQTALNACVSGSNLVVDGKFGPLTKGVFVSFQNSKNIKPDGIIGPVTAQHLADCSGGAAVNNGSNGSTVMSGTEGYLSNDVKLGAYNSTKVMEGDRDKVVFGFEVLAKDADQKIDGLSIALTNSNGASSKKITRYASEISVWLDGKEIGRKSVSNYSSDSSDVYTYRFTGMTGVIKQNMKGQVVIAVSGTTTMDSTDATNEAWAINVGTAVSGSTNYVSAVSPNGRYRDYGSAALASSTIDFQKAGGVSSDQKFKVTTASTNPVAQSVQVSNTSDTTDKLLLAFDAKAENAGMIVQKIPAIVTTTIGLADGVAPNPEAIVKTLKLYANGTLLATESIPSGVSTQTVTFGNISKLNYAIAANATAKFEIRADLNDIESTGIVSTDFDNGDKVAVSVNSGTMTVELDNVNKDTVSNVTGSSTGENQDLRAEGMLVTMGAMSSSATSNNDGEIINRTISIPVTIKALDSTVYVDNAIQNAATVSGTNALSFVFEDNTGATDTIVNSATLTSSNAPVEGNGYRIDSGTERSFMVTIIANGVPTEAQKQYRVQLTQGQSWTNAALTVGSAVQDLAPVNAYESPYFSLNLN
jgi:peptidoglycan hydrolase-like protein with peptidoglycan-binding domain